MVCGKVMEIDRAWFTTLRSCLVTGVPRASAFEVRQWNRRLKADAVSLNVGLRLLRTYS